jgi:hypothetical protein
VLFLYLSLNFIGKARLSILSAEPRGKSSRTQRILPLDIAAQTSHHLQTFPSYPHLMVISFDLAPNTAHMIPITAAGSNRALITLFGHEAQTFACYSHVQ